MTPFCSTPPLSAEPETYFVYLGIASVIVTSSARPIVFLYVILYVSTSPPLTVFPSTLVDISSLKTSFLGLVGGSSLVSTVFVGTDTLSKYIFAAEFVIVLSPSTSALLFVSVL